MVEMTDGNPAQLAELEISDAARKLSKNRRVRSGGKNGGRGKESSDERKLKRNLQGLSDAVLVYLFKLDGLLLLSGDLPRQLASDIAKLSNALEMANDRIRYFDLKVDFRKDDKAKAYEQAYRRLSKGKGGL